MIPRSSVVLDCNIFGLQRFGGISNYWEHIVSGVNADPLFTGKLIVPNKPAYSGFKSISALQMPSRIEVLPSAITRYLPILSNKNAVLHTSYYRLPISPVKKYIVTVYDFTYERYRYGLPRFIHTKQKLASIRCADSVICISESTKNDVIEFCPEINIRKLHVIPLAVDRDLFFPDSSSLNVGMERTVLFVGQRGGYKRFDLAIDAIRASPSLVLGVVGPPLTNNEKVLLMKKIGSRWREFGPISSAVLRTLYSSAYAFIFPSDYEGFGLPILEAMACGCPVIASRLSSLPEIGGVAAYYAKSQEGEAYAVLLSDLEVDAVRVDSIYRGIKHTANSSWVEVLAKTKTLYVR